MKQKEKVNVDHHYELRSEGLRTFRFDPPTGEICIQLTSEADWKRKATKCSDTTAHYLGMPTETDHQQKVAGAEGNV